MNIGFIGAGRVGCTLGKYLVENIANNENYINSDSTFSMSSISNNTNITNGMDRFDTDMYINVTGYYSRTKKSADDAATFTQSKVFKDLETLVNESDTIFITTPDDAIEKVWESIKGFNLRDKVICHFSGSLSSDIFSGIEETGASCCSIHPMYAFSDKFTSYLLFNTACLTMEGQHKAVEVMTALFSKRLHHKIFMIKPSDKAKYHAAASFASNYVVGVIHVALELLYECGFSKEDAITLISPIALNNVNSVVKNGTVSALTGPVERNDTKTVLKHTEVLEGTIRENIYKNLGQVLVSIAEKKNCGKDYSELKKLMEG